VAWLNASDGSLWRSRIDGSERIELTTPPLRIFSMKWSPDNKRLALMAEEPGMPWKLYLIDSEGGKPTPLLNEDRNEADPDWSADGQSIVFGRLPNRMDSRQPKAIYLLELQTHKVTEIPGSTGLFSPRLSPDGRYIAAMRLDQKALLLFRPLRKSAGPPHHSRGRRSRPGPTMAAPSIFRIFLRKASPSIASPFPRESHSRWPPSASLQARLPQPTTG
jgi:Tol biopolymer transport system component